MKYWTRHGNPSFSLILTTFVFNICYIIQIENLIVFPKPMYCHCPLKFKFYFSLMSCLCGNKSHKLIFIYLMCTLMMFGALILVYLKMY